MDIVNELREFLSAFAEANQGIPLGEIASALGRVSGEIHGALPDDLHRNVFSVAFMTSYQAGLNSKSKPELLMGGDENDGPCGPDCVCYPQNELN